jgi:hypothetical protein
VDNPSAYEGMLLFLLAATSSRLPLPTHASCLPCFEGWSTCYLQVLFRYLNDGGKEVAVMTYQVHGPTSFMSPSVVASLLCCYCWECGLTMCAHVRVWLCPCRRWRLHRGTWRSTYWRIPQCAPVTPSCWSFFPLLISLSPSSPACGPV